jgi:aspartate ammonia-lyase
MKRTTIRFCSKLLPSFIIQHQKVVHKYPKTIEHSRDVKNVGITVGGMQGHYELNVFKPIIAANFLQSARLIADACISFERNCAIGLNQITKI